MTTKRAKRTKLIRQNGYIRLFLYGWYLNIYHNEFVIYSRKSSKFY